MKLALALTILATVLSLTSSSPLLAGDEILETQEFTLVDGVRNDLFGGALATHNGLLLAGAIGEDTNRLPTGGAFLLNARTGEVIQRLAPIDLVLASQFGAAVDVFGDRAIVGARSDHQQGRFAGAAYLYEVPSGQGIVKLLPANGNTNDRFGISVALDEGLALIGASYRSLLAPRAGSAFLFDAVNGIELRELLDPDVGFFDEYGTSVALDDGLAAIGSPFDDDSGPDAGAVYVLDIATGNRISKLTADDAEAGDQFGISLALEGNLALVGAWKKQGVGAAYLFDATSGQQLAKLEPPTGQATNLFGWRVDLKGNFALVGTRAFSVTTGGPGAAFLFDVESGQLLTKLSRSQGLAGDEHGHGVALDDRAAFVGTPFATLEFVNEGAVYSYDLEDYFETGVPYCFGDGSGTSCPCAASGGPGEGCANSSGSGGALLVGEGNASVAHSNFQLAVSGVPGAKPGLILRGLSQLGGGLGVGMGDGLFCTSGNSARSQVQVTAAGETLFSDFKGQTFGEASYGAGVTANYQFWYRDAQNTCSGQGFNFSNAWSVTWTL